MSCIYDTMKQGSCFKIKLTSNERISLLTLRGLGTLDTRVSFVKREVLHKRCVDKFTQEMRIFSHFP